MIKKQCKLCGEYKDIVEFVNNKIVKSGYGNRCKKCNNKESYKSRVKNRTHYTRLVNSYRKTDVGKIKTSARQKVKTAIRSGKLKRLPCEICGSKLSEAHHKNYLKPLEVNWLCRSHHVERHQK